ncbi:MAG: mandelate racemase/muconate lactonizing enzyme family protein [Halofilum sp. (in: g-proteobacteria)]
MTIRDIRISHHQLPLDPPFPAAWDTQPRRLFPATVVRVEDDSGQVGIGSGDPMHGIADYLSLFIGRDPLDLHRHSEVLANIDFHAGRPWALEVALWDLAGKLRGEAGWQMAGGRSQSIAVYASSGVHRDPADMAALARRVHEEGIPALKIRFGRASLDEDFAVLARIRAEVGDGLELMVDCNQGWRMPWDTQPTWDYAQAIEVARELERYGVYWMEEPLHRGDYAGMARLRADTELRIAGGEMTRELHEFHTLLERECLDVYQPDAVCSLGLTRLKALAETVVASGCEFTPHTWGNGIGLLANAHLTGGSVGASFIELPYDPPEWSPERRDFPLAEALYPDASGRLNLGDEPGLGIHLNEALLERTGAESTGYTRNRMQAT